MKVHKLNARQEKLIYLCLTMPKTDVFEELRPWARGKIHDKIYDELQELAKQFEKKKPINKDKPPF